MSKNKKSVLINGCLGRMGYSIINELMNNFPNIILKYAIERDDHPLIGTELYKNLQVTKFQNNFEVDFIIDFSSPKSSLAITRAAAKLKIPIVIGTTGFNNKNLNELKKLSKKIPILQSYNMSIGINMLIKIMRDNFKYFKNTDLEILEKHHSQKIDSPSGTALLIAENLASLKKKNLKSFIKFRNLSNNMKRKKDEVGISSIRGGNVIGEHTLFSYSEKESLSITHQAHDRSVFAQGAIELGLKLLKKKTGFFNVTDLL
tara:strand:+ start:960 stop:1739 length:780 start_codon:yes stop_codon:yes gene_type:complete